MKKLFILDWDDSLRIGYSALAWVEFLTSHGHFNASDEIINLVIKYKNRDKVKAANAPTEKPTTYEDFVNGYADIYRRGIAGFQVSQIERLAVEFARIERSKHLYPYTTNLLDYLEANNFTVVLISGSPLVVLEAFFAGWPRIELHGLRCTVVDGMYTAEAGNLSGGKEGKKNVVLPLLAQFDYVGGLGDSPADLSYLNLCDFALVAKTKLADSDMVVPFTRVTAETHFEEFESILTASWQVDNPEN